MEESQLREKNASDERQLVFLLQHHFFCVKQRFLTDLGDGHLCSLLVFQ